MGSVGGELELWVVGVRSGDGVVGVSGGRRLGEGWGEEGVFGGSKGCRMKGCFGGSKRCEMKRVFGGRKGCEMKDVCGVSKDVGWSELW